MSHPELSVVVPVFNERDNVAPLVGEIVAALRGHLPFEIVYVDDNSRDDSLAVLQGLKASTPELRVLHHVSQSGQSTAVRTGVRNARAPWIATLDGDGQNDPADIPKLLAARQSADAQVKLFAGWRVNRQDSGSKRWASKWANAIRARMLRDDTPDTGCGIKLFEREAFLDLPYFDHMHRYLPALMQRAGWKTTSVPVNHRHRTAGVSKYNNLGRALVGIRDLRGVAWLITRSKRADVRRPLAGAVRRLQACRQAGHPAPVLVHERGRQPDDAELLPVLGQAGLGGRAAEPVPGVHRAVQPAAGHQAPGLEAGQGQSLRPRVRIPDASTHGVDLLHVRRPVPGPACRGWSRLSVDFRADFATSGGRAAD